MNKKYLCKFIVFVFLIIFSFHCDAQSTQNLCLHHGVVAGYYNGVSNTTTDAGDGMNKLNKLIGTKTSQGVDIEWEVLYNTSETAPSNATVTTDVTTTTQAPPMPLTEKEKIEALEKLGKLPTLDRSDSLLGHDLDKNGIRDDIDAYIMSQNFTEPQKKAAQQVAKASANQLVLNTSSQNEVKITSVQLSRAINCICDVFREGDSYRSVVISKNIEKMTANTKKRTEAYIKFITAMNGETISVPNGDTCE